MHKGLFLRSLAVQTASVAVLFTILVVLPLPTHFFKDYGPIAGPASWIVASVATSLVLRLPPTLALIAALAGGVAGAVVGRTIDHSVGLVVGLLAFAAACATLGSRRAEPHPARAGE